MDLEDTPKRGRRFQVQLLSSNGKEKDDDGNIIVKLQSPHSPIKLDNNADLSENKTNEAYSIGSLEKKKEIDEISLKDEKIFSSSQITFFHTFSSFNDREGSQENEKCVERSNIEINKDETINEKGINDNQQTLSPAKKQFSDNESMPLKGRKKKNKISQNSKKALVWKARKKMLMTYVKKLLGFLLSTVGLFILLFSYTLLGGIIFHEIESPNEIITKHGVDSSIKYHVKLLWNKTRVYNVLREDIWKKFAEEVLKNYTEVIYRATKNDGWDGKNDEAALQWSFAGSLLYCVTVITTIGYGHIAPKTDLGRLVTIFYAIFGIPLCLLSITHVGGFMATVFRFLYKNIFCGLFCFYCNKLKNRKNEKFFDEKKEIKETTESCSKTTNSKGFCCVCCFKKKKETPTEQRLLEKQVSDDPITDQKDIGKTSASGRLRQSYKTIVKWRRGIHNALFTDENKHIQVPIYVSLLLIGGYIALGALLFGLWESEWNFLISSYFCFITLSTIGFGDFVPGTSLDPSSSQEKLVICTLYLIIGLALLAMCFDLMQEEARHMFHNLGKKLGLINSDDDDGKENTAGRFASRSSFKKI